MNSRPRWLLWAGVTVVLWSVWIVFAYLPLRQRHEQEGHLRTDWTTKQYEMLSRIEAAPTIMEQIAGLDRQLDSMSLLVPAAPALKEYCDALGELARQSGVGSVEVKPQLESMMSLNKSTNQQSLLLDTLVVEFTAIGGFQRIGRWLDNIESETAFRYWGLGRWDKGDEPGTVRFTGSAAFLVAVPKGGVS